MRGEWLIKGFSETVAHCEMGKDSITGIEGFTLLIDGLKSMEVRGQ